MHILKWEKNPNIGRNLAFVFFLTKKGNGLKLYENRMDAYRSWTRIDWKNQGLDENSVGRKPLGPKWIGRKVGLPSGICTTSRYTISREARTSQHHGPQLRATLKSPTHRDNICYITKQLHYLKKKQNYMIPKTKENKVECVITHPSTIANNTSLPPTFSSSPPLPAPTAHE